jgi:DNA-3-methyladenine glycosylase II
MPYKNHLAKDKKLATIINENHHQLAIQKNIPLRLMRSILGQQLSTKVAQVIYDRFIALYNNKEPKPQQVIDTPNEVLRAIGLSNAKVQYVKNVAIFCIENKITDKKLAALTDEEIVEKLLAIKGVGKWTVEMLMMFSLGREDVFSVDDLGIQQAMTKLYNLDATNKKEMKEKMITISNKWKPYRTYACLHLWQWKDNKPA